MSAAASPDALASASHYRPVAPAPSAGELVQAANAYAAQGRDDLAIAEFERAMRLLDGAQDLDRLLANENPTHLLALPLFERHPEGQPRSIFDCLDHRPIYTDGIYGGVYLIRYRPSSSSLSVRLPHGLRPPPPARARLTRADVAEAAFNVLFAQALTATSLPHASFHMETRNRRRASNTRDLTGVGLVAVESAGWWTPVRGHTFLVLPVDLLVAGTPIQVSHSYRAGNARDHREIALLVFELEADATLTLRDVRVAQSSCASDAVAAVASRDGRFIGTVADCSTSGGSSAWVCLLRVDASNTLDWHCGLP